MSEEQEQRTPLRVGFVGLGDQGLPMAVAIAESGHELHVWARRPQSLAGLAANGVEYWPEPDLEALAAAVDAVALCVGTDADVEALTAVLLPAMRAGAVLINHGTGTPANARRLASTAASVGVAVLDAPVSGGRPAAEARTLTVLVGGDEEVLERVRAMVQTFASHVVHVGDAGAGQTAKLFNNALLMLNQASIAEVLRLGAAVGMDPVVLVDALRLGSANSRALELTNTMVNPGTVQHLSQVEALDIQIFDEAMRDAGVDPGETVARGLAGADSLPEVIDRLNP